MKLEEFVKNIKSGDMLYIVPKFEIRIKFNLTEDFYSSLTSLPIQEVKWEMKNDVMTPSTLSDNYSNKFLFDDNLELELIKWVGADDDILLRDFVYFDNEVDAIRYVLVSYCELRERLYETYRKIEKSWDVITNDLKIEELKDKYPERWV